MNRGRIERDRAIEDTLINERIKVHIFNGSLLFEPQTTRKEDDTPYRVFTPFYKNGCLGKGDQPRRPHKSPKGLSITKHKGLELKDFGLLPTIPWHSKLEKYWKPGEAGAQARLTAFLKNGLHQYKEGRNHPARENVSRLSPHLHFGEISPNEVWYAAKQKMIGDRCRADGEHFLSEMGWREFSNNLLYHFPDLPRINLQTKFNAFPWRKAPKGLKTLATRPNRISHCRCWHA